MGEREGQSGHRMSDLRFYLMDLADQLHRALSHAARRLSDAVLYPFRVPFRFLSSNQEPDQNTPSHLSRLERLRMRRRLKNIQKQSAKDRGRSGIRSAVLNRHPRLLSRLATLFLAVMALVAIGYLSRQNRQFDNGDPVASAGSLLEVPSSTPLPTPTDAPTNTPIPTSTDTPTPLPTNTPTPSPVPTEEPPTSVSVEDAQPALYDPLRFGGVAFTMRKDGNSDIYTLMVGLEDPIRLTSHHSDDRDPAWSPDGQYLAFSSRRDGNWEIYILDLLTGGIERLTNNLAYDGSPAWSPDGQWLVYESYQDENLDLYIVKADGDSSPTRLTEHPAQDFAPAWSPRGRHIAFTSWRSGNKDIFIMSLNTLSDAEAVNVTASPGAYEDDAVFSPDGQYLAYSDESDGYDVIYIRQLADSYPTGSAQSLGQGRHPSWSPDSKSVVYVHQNHDQFYLIASSLDAWNTAPQVYVSDQFMGDSAWSQIALPTELGLRLDRTTAILDDPLFFERVSRNSELEPPLLLFEVDVDAPAPYLNDRVDQSFASLRQRVIEEVGWDFLGRVDNMYEPLDSKPVPGAPVQSWNKTGRAFDFYYRYPISVDPQVEIVREERGNETYWRVYLRTALQDGSQGEPLRQRSWDFEARYGEDPQYYDQGGKWKEEPPDGYYLDFTALAEDYGWQRVPGEQNWRNYFQGIRYWHFENRQGLTYDEALLEIFTIEELSTDGGNP